MGWWGRINGARLRKRLFSIVGFAFACRVKYRAAMDSKLVSRELWKLVRPVLKNAGWTSFSSRTARRFSNARIDVVNWEICEHVCRPQSVIADHGGFTVA